MTRFITYTDPLLAALEDQRQLLLKRLSKADAALEASLSGTLVQAFLQHLSDAINAELDEVAARIVAREAELDGRGEEYIAA